MSTIPVDITKTYNIYSNLKYQWWSLSKLHNIHLLTLPVDIPPHYHQKKHQSNLLTLSPQNKGSQIYHQHSLWLLLLLHVFHPVPLQVLVYQIYSSILIHMYYPNINLQDPISYHPLFQTQSFLPTTYCQCHLQNNYINTQVLTHPHPQYSFHIQL